MIDQTAMAFSGCIRVFADDGDIAIAIGSPSNIEYIAAEIADKFDGGCFR